jgi:NADH:ubiquinone oxidoreductase 27 kD subunit
MKEEAMNEFGSQMTRKLGKKFDLRWDVDRKGVVCGWCKLDDPDDIYPVAEVVAGFKGRVMTISPLNTPSALADYALGDTPDDAPENAPAAEKTVKVVINYHFYFEGINLTACITLPDNQRTVKSITPVLISADWHEREMQELFNVKLQGHPNPKRLFLEKGIHMTDHTMIPLSEALNGASTNTLWEKIMRSNTKEANPDE